MEHNDCLYAASVSEAIVRKMTQRTMPLVRKIAFKQFVEVLLGATLEQFV